MTHNYNFDRPPHTISVTFFRNENSELPISFHETDDDGIRVTDVSWLATPIEEGDLLMAVDVNGRSHSAKDLLQYQLTGIMTLKFRKDSVKVNPHLRGAFFVQPQVHTCLPMGMDLHQENGSLVIGSVDSKNEWLSNTETCFLPGQSLVAINGTACHQLDAEAALLFIQTKLDTDPYLYITTTTLPPEALSGMLSEEEETLHLFVMGLVTLNGNKGLTNPPTTRVGDYSAFVNAKQLFMAIQKSLARIQIQNQAACQSLGRGLFPFCQNVLCKILLDYSAQLKHYVPSPASQSRPLKKLGRNLTGKAKPTPNWSYRYRIDSSEALRSICQVISTCEYAANQTQALQEMLQELQETRNMELLREAIESFYDIIAEALPILVSGLMQRLKEGFLEMRAVNFRKIKMIEEENAYVHTFAKEIQPYFDIVTEENLLPTYYLRNFGDKFVLAFCEVYYDILLNIIRHTSKRHHAMTIQQLLMDVYHLKEIFMKLPVKELVVKSFRHIEALLKGEWQLEHDPADEDSDVSSGRKKGEEETVIEMQVPYVPLGGPLVPETSDD